MSVQRGLDGFELGAATINAILTFGLLVLTAVISIIVTYPEVSVRPLLIILGSGAIVLPVVFYPFTYTIWFAVELMMEPPSDSDLVTARKRIGEGVRADT
jgi:NhaP-type Na+/H+ or K+/H+ antiporter